jgi:hypothetical protein
MPKKQKRDHQPKGPSNLLIFLAYLAYLRSMRPPPPPETTAVRWLVLALITMTLISAGAPDMVGEVLRHLAIVP